MTLSDNPAAANDADIKPATPQPAKKNAVKKPERKDWDTLGSIRDSFAVLMEQDITLQRPSRY